MNFKQTYKTTLPISLVLLSVVFALGIYAYIGTFNRLMGDSLCSYYFAERLGLLRSIWFWRLIWSGRYSAYGFDWLLTKILPPQSVPLFIPVILIIWVFLNTWALFLILKKKSPNTNMIPAALLLGAESVFITLSASLYIQQSFYWIDGFRAYTLPIIILAVYLILYYLFIDKVNTKARTVIAVFIAFSLSVLGGGLSETFAAFQFALFLLAIGYYWLVEHPTKVDRTMSVLFAGWVGSWIAIAVIVTAPGNSVRQEYFPPPPGLFDLIAISAKSYINFLNTIWSTPQKLMAVLGGILSAVWVGTTVQGDFSSHGKKILLFITLAVLLSFACFPPGVYGYSDAPPDRVLIIAIFIFTSLLMSAGFWTGNLLKLHIANKQIIRLSLLVGMHILLIGSAWIVSKSLYDDRTRYIEYAHAWDEIDTIIKTAKNEGKETIIVKTVPNWAGMDQLNNNPNHWVNECYSNFYGIQVFGED